MSFQMRQRSPLGPNTLVLFVLKGLNENRLTMVRSTFSDKFFRILRNFDRERPSSEKYLYPICGNCWTRDVR